MSLLRILGTAGAVALLAGCATVVPLQRDQAGALTRNAEAAEVDRALGKATPVAQFDFEANGKPFFARHYNLQTGMRQEMTMVCTTFCFPVSYTIPVTAEYVVVQRLPSRSLHAWGTLEELSKDPDPEISGIMPALKARYETEKQKKK
jgi:hypothetical protein